MIFNRTPALFTFSTAVLLLSVWCWGCSSGKLTEEERINQRIDSLRRELSEVKRQKVELILNHYHQEGLFNGNVLLIEHGKTLYQKSYGFADFRNKTPLQAQSVFQVGALTQQFTAMLVLMLVDQERITLEDPVYYYIKGWPYRYTTIEQLLTHTSGVPDYISYFYSLSEDLMTYATNRNVLDWLVRDKPPIRFEPGTRWDFSHTNYVALTEVIEHVYQRKYGEILEEQLLKPLGMKETYLPLQQQALKALEHRVFGFQPDNINLHDDNFLNKIYGDRGLYTSTGDLYRWSLALDTEELVDKALLARVFRPVPLKIGLSYPFGYGWYIDEIDGYVYQMSGWLGFKCMILKIPKEKHTIIVLTNNVNPVFQEIKQTLVNIMLNKPYPLPG